MAQPVFTRAERRRELERILMVPVTDERAHKALEETYPDLFEQHAEVLNLIEAILAKEYPGS